MPLAHLPFS